MSRNRYVRYELVLRIEVDTTMEPNAEIAASDTLRFAHRHLIQKDGRMYNGFGTRIVGAQVRDIGPCMTFGCPGGELIADVEDDEAAA